MSKKVRFNILDFSIVLFAILAIIAAIFWNDIREEFSYEEVTAEYEFKITGVSQEALSSLSVNDDITFSEDGTYVGKIQKLKSIKETGEAILKDGSKKTYEDNTYIVTGTVVLKGRQKDNGFYIAGKHFTVYGKKFDVQTSSVKFTMEILEADN